MQRPAPRLFWTKLVEAGTGLALTWRYGRRAVLAQYLRLVPYGNGSHGIAHAAWFYFDKPMADLSWAQIAVLMCSSAGPLAHEPAPARRLGSGQGTGASDIGGAGPAIGDVSSRAGQCRGGACRHAIAGDPPSASGNLAPGREVRTHSGAVRPSRDAEHRSESAANYGRDHAQPCGRVGRRRSAAGQPDGGSAGHAGGGDRYRVLVLRRHPRRQHRLHARQSVARQHAEAVLLRGGAAGGRVVAA